MQNIFEKRSDPGDKASNSSSPIAGIGTVILQLLFYKQTSAWRHVYLKGQRLALVLIVLAF